MNTPALLISLQINKGQVNKPEVLLSSRWSVRGLGSVLIRSLQSYKIWSVTGEGPDKETRILSNLTSQRLKAVLTKTH